MQKMSNYSPIYTATDSDKSLLPFWKCLMASAGSVWNVTDCSAMLWIPSQAQRHLLEEDRFCVFGQDLSILLGSVDSIAGLTDGKDLSDHPLYFCVPAELFPVGHSLLFHPLLFQLWAPLVKLLHILTTYCQEAFPETELKYSVLKLFPCAPTY